MLTDCIGASQVHGHNFYYQKYYQASARSSSYSSPPTEVLEPGLPTAPSAKAELEVSALGTRITDHENTYGS